MNTNDELMLSSPENMRQRYSIDEKKLNSMDAVLGVHWSTTP